MTEVARWLDARTPAMPEELRRALDIALERCTPLASTDAGVTDARATDARATDSSSTADRLAEAGLAALRRSIDDASTGEPDRQTAHDLLAADALLTYACEAAAEEGPAALDRLTGSLDFRRFETLLEPEAK